MKNRAYFGFTISELMIAMAIVGIIAAVTIPAVVSRYQQQSMLALLKKNYVELQENLLLLYAENFRTNFFNSTLAKNTGNIRNFFNTYYTISNIGLCGEDAQPCFADSYRSINSAARTAFSCNDGYSVLLKSAGSMCIIPAQPDIAEDAEAGVEAEAAKPAHVFLDVNRYDKAKIGGRDIV